MNVDFKAGISGIGRVEGCIWQIFQEWVSDSPFNMTSKRGKESGGRYYHELSGGRYDSGLEKTGEARKREG